MSHASAFKTPEGEAAFLAAYEAAMKLWPVPYEELETSGRFGMTHVIVSGPESHENGKFGWIMDPDGNKVELWEPMIWDDKNKGT